MDNLLEIIIDDSNELLEDVRKSEPRKTFKVSLDKIASYGGSAAVLVKGINDIKKIIKPVEGIYKLVNAKEGTILKGAKDGTFYGAFIDENGKSVMAKFVKAVPGVASFNPWVLFIVAAAITVETGINKVISFQKDIISFLEADKESEIEADVKTLLNIIQKYPSNYDNEHYLTSNHKMVLDIKRTALKNMTFYEKRIERMISTKEAAVFIKSAELKHDELKKQFKYYRLAVYAFALATFIELVLSNNFKEENILASKSEIILAEETYQKMLTKAEDRLDNMSKKSAEANTIKVLGRVTATTGKVLGAIGIRRPARSLQNTGGKLEDNSTKMKEQYSNELDDSLKDTHTEEFVERMDELLLMFNHTKAICADDKNLYLVFDNKEK